MATLVVSPDANPRPRASGCVHTALDLGEPGELQALTGHGDEAVVGEDAVVVAELDGAGQERTRPGEGDELEHLRHVGDG